jgi:hypothetical protein
MIAFQPRLKVHVAAGRRRPPQPAQMPLTLPGPESSHRTAALDATAHAAVNGKVRSAPSGGTNPQREPAEVIDQAADYRDHGARYLVIANIGVLQPNLRKAMTSNLPFAKIIRGLKRL